MRAISAAVPIDTASAPSARALAASAPFLMPPDTTSWTSPSTFMSSSARTASQTALRVGMPVWSSSTSGEAPVAPSMPSSTITSALPLTASLMSSATRLAPSLT